MVEKDLQPGMVVHDCCLSPREVEVGQTGDPGQFWQTSKFKSSLGYIMRPDLTQKINKTPK